MSTKRLLIRIAVFGLPLIVIALIAGGAGYMTEEDKTQPVPPLPAVKERTTGVQGTVESFSNDKLSIITSDGEAQTLNVPGESAIERLVTINRDELKVGDWLNGGAISHPDTILVLVGLVLIADPVIPPP